MNKKIFILIVIIIIALVSIIFFNRTKDFSRSIEFETFYLSNSDDPYTRDTLVKLEYNSNLESPEDLVISTKKWPGEALGGVQSGKDVVIIHKRDENKLISLKEDFSEKNSISFGNIRTFRIFDEFIYVCGEGDLIVLNYDLEEMGRIDLNLKGWEDPKDAHDIIVYQDIAYLLDNLVVPTYILKVDVSSKENMEILETREIFGVYTSLLFHWLNPELKQWLIIISESGRFGSSNSIGVYSTEEVSLINRQNIYSSIRDFEGLDKTEISGIKIAAVTDFSPAWAIISDEGLFLAKITSNKDGEVDFQKIFEINIDGRIRFIEEKEDHLFLLIGETFMVFDVNKPSKPVIVREL